MGPWENSSLWYTTIKIEWNEAAEMKLMEALPSPTAIQNGAKKIVNLYLIKRKMVFCHQNCSDLPWEKTVLVIEKNFLNSQPSASNFKRFWDH